MRFNHPIRSLDALYATASTGTLFTPAMDQFAGHEEKLKELGLNWPLVIGEAVLPPGHCGDACSKNANGWDEKHRDRPLEIFHYLQLWKWRMTRRTYFDHAERMIEREGKRHPRSLHPPLSMELQVLKRDDGSVVLAMPSVGLRNENKTQLINAINVVVELFGTCRVLNETLQPVTPIHRAHWRVLPVQTRSWANVTALSEKAIEGISSQRCEILKMHFETICTFHPLLCAIGQQGFSGLLVYGFPSHRLHLLEGFCRNETVGIVGDWPAISELPICDLLQDSAGAFKIPHAENWYHELIAKLSERNVGI